MPTVGIPELFLMRAFDTRRSPGCFRQRVFLDTLPAFLASSVSAVIQPDEGVGNVLEVLELVVGYFKELDLHLPLKVALERHDMRARLFCQAQSFHRLG